MLYRTTPLFLKLFGLRSVEELPELEQWDPSPEDQAALRDRLLRAGDERSGAVGQCADAGPAGRLDAPRLASPRCATSARPSEHRTCTLRRR